MTTEPDVVVVGAGPAGLALSLELRRLGLAVVVLDREAEAGGVPRHCAHQGFGLRDLHRSMTGPAYARRYAELARTAGVGVLTASMVTGWSDDRGLEVTSPRGRELLKPGAVVLATGCRERPRSARLIPGARPEGVMTTGTLQQLVHLHRRRPGRRALIVGAEHVAYSALLTLAHNGIDVVGMTTELPRHQTFEAFALAASLRFRVPLWTRTALGAILGSRRVEAVELVDLDRGRVRLLACDTVVLTADWIPDHELAALGGIELDPGTQGPAVDPGQHTSRPGVFAVGNLLHGAEPADVAALRARRAAPSVTRYLGSSRWPQARLPIVCHPPIRWVVPNVVAPGTERGERMLIRSSEFLRRPSIRIEQEGRSLWSGSLRRLVPGRSGRVSTGWIASVDPAGGAIGIRALPGDSGAALGSP